MSDRPESIRFNDDGAHQRQQLRDRSSDGLRALGYQHRSHGSGTSSDNQLNGDTDDDGDHASENSAKSEESFTMRDRQNAINTAHPFGIRLWKPALYRKRRSLDVNADEDIKSAPNCYVPVFVRIGNLVWSLTFGLVLFITLGIIWLPIFLLSLVSTRGHRYADLLRKLMFYFLNPFGKYVQLIYNEHYRFEDDGHGRPVEDYLAWQQNTDGEAQPSRLFFAPRRRRPSQHFSRSNTGFSSNDTNADADDEIADGTVVNHLRLFGRGRWSAARVIYYLGYYLILTPVAAVIISLCWLGVIGVPMARVVYHMIYHMRIHPLALNIRSTKYNFSDAEANNPNAFSIILCTYRAFGLKYYKYTVNGTNVILLNMLFIVFVTIFDTMVTKILPQSVHFFLSLVSIIPLAHFIGHAVASISAQSSMTMGATINAFFSTIVEVYLYLVALNQGKGELVEGSITGSVLAGVLLMPGLSMCAGAFKYKQQRFNPRSAGATSTMLLYTVVGVIAPTIFYSLYGPSEVRCSPVPKNEKPSILEETARICWSVSVPLRSDDPLYQKIIKPFSWICAVALFIAYAIGLLFTLRTHAALIWSNNPTGGGGATTIVANGNGAIIDNPGATVSTDDVTNLEHETHVANEAAEEGPTWSRKKSYIILLTATLLYAMIAEVLVDSVDVILQNVKISQRMLGITIFALVPNTTEFLNAISFALYGNVALSLEIGSAYALQVCLLQIPALVLSSQSNVATHSGEFLRDYVFVLLVPKWDTWAWIISMVLYCHVHSEGRSNYFKGSILILAYLVLVVGFYFNDAIYDAFPDSAWGNKLMFLQ